MFLDSCEVGNKIAHEECQERYDSVKTDRRIKALNMEAIIATATKAYNKLLSIADEIHDWAAEHFVIGRKAAETSTEEFGGHFAALLDYRASVQLVYAQQQKENAKQQRNATRHAKSLAETMETMKCPAPIDAVAASILLPQKGHERVAFEASVPYGGDGALLGQDD